MNSTESKRNKAESFAGKLGAPDDRWQLFEVPYYEFEEIGMNRQLGYGSPAGIVDLYPQFYCCLLYTSDAADE